MIKVSYVALACSMVFLAVGFITVNKAMATSGTFVTDRIIVPEDGLTFETIDGKVLAELRMVGSTPAFYICNDKGDPSIMLTTIQNGGSVSIFSQDGYPMAWLESSEFGGRIAIFNNSNKLIGTLGVRGVSDEALAMNGEDGWIALGDYEGERIWSAP